MAQTKSSTGTASNRAVSKSGTSSKGKTSGTSSENTNNSSSENGESSMLEELFLDSIKDIYWAEKHLLKALPKMEKAATSQELKAAFADHLNTTKTQVGRLEQAFEMLGKKAQGKKCEAMDGLSKEAESIIEDTEKGTMTRDVGLIMAAQKVEHYEIATYGSLAQLAKTIGNNELADLMVQTLEEEKEADQLLTSLAENNINVEATAE